MKSLYLLVISSLNLFPITLPFGSIIMCGFKPNILFVRSVLKPFMTDITIIKIATPSIIPKKEKIEITFKKPSFFFGFKFLDEMNFSDLVNNLTN